MRASPFVVHGVGNTPLKDYQAMSIIENRKAFHDFFIEERHEAGIILEGWEVKAIRAGRSNIKEAYVIVRDEELFLFGMHISPLPSASTHVHADPVRTRKLRRSAQSWWLLLRRNAAGAVCATVVASCCTVAIGRSGRPSWKPAIALAIGNWTPCARPAARRWWSP